MARSGQAVKELLLVFDTLPLEGFLPLLMEGVGIEIPAGCTAGSLLRDCLGLSVEEVETRVATVCVDGHPVDDLGRCPLGDGSRIALSGALPGLVGACLRRGGQLAGMRRSITMTEAQPGVAGTVTVRLFNVLLPLLGPRVLAGSVVLDRGTLVRFLASRADRFWLSARSATLGGRALSLPLSETVCESLPDERLRLRVHTTTAGPAAPDMRGTNGAGRGQAVRHVA
jgi:hypothetical protein